VRHAYVCLCVSICVAHLFVACSRGVDKFLKTLAKLASS
jgi:hypothetical protein